LIEADKNKRAYKKMPEIAKKFRSRRLKKLA